MGQMYLRVLDGLRVGVGGVGVGLPVFVPGDGGTNAKPS